MAGILRVDQANVDYVYAKTTGGKVYIPGHVIQVVTANNGTNISGTSTSFVNLWSFSINNVSLGSKIIIDITVSHLFEGSEASEWRVVRNSDTSLVGVAQNFRASSTSGWAHTYPRLVVEDNSPTVGTNTYILQAKGVGASPYYYFNYPGVSTSYSFLTITEVAR